MNEHLAAKISGYCVANLRNSLLLRAIRRLVPENFSSNLHHPELIRGSLRQLLTGENNAYSHYP